jgi:hypothetical protein
LGGDGDRNNGVAEVEVSGVTVSQQRLGILLCVDATSIPDAGASEDDVKGGVGAPLLKL